MSNEWIQHVKNVAEQRNLSYKDAMKLARETYKKGEKLTTKDVKGMAKNLNPFKKPSKMRGKATAEAVKEGIEQVGTIVGDITSGVADSISRFELWRDYIVPLMERELSKYGYTSLYDPKINQDWLSGKGRKKLTGGLDIAKVVGDVSRTETLRAIRILKKPLDILQQKSGKKRDLRWLSREIGVPLKIAFPIDDIEDFVD